MSDESQLQTITKDADSSLIILSAQSGLIARGRRDAVMRAATVEGDPEEVRSGMFSGWHAWDDVGDRSIEDVRADAERDDARHQNILAFHYLFGARRDLTEAARWYGKAADQGYARAQFNLGWMFDNKYLCALGMEQDYVAAASWYRKAADQGLAAAQFNLGTMYDTGEGVPLDYAEAVKWYRNAADQGLDKAQFNLGLKYNKGQSLARDFGEAAKWYREAANKGLAPAQFNLGLKYENGQGVARECVEAYMWMTLAIAHANDEDAQRYAAGRDRLVAKMSSAQIAEAQLLAARWYRNAADQGSLVAQFRLSALYESGEGVLQDYIQAYMWISLAISRLQTPEYAAMRENVAAKMSSAQIAEAQRLAREWKSVAKDNG